MHLEDMVSEIVYGFLLLPVMWIAFYTLVCVLGWLLRKLRIVR